MGKYQFHVFSALAEFERDLIRDRTLARLRAAGPRSPRIRPGKRLKISAPIRYNPPVEQETHPYQHFADRPIIDRDLVPLYDLTPAAYQRIVNDRVNLVGAVLGYVQQRGRQSLAQAVASDARAILIGYDEDVAKRVPAIAAHGAVVSRSTSYSGAAMSARGAVQTSAPAGR